MLTLGFVVEALTGYQSVGGPHIITDVALDSRLCIPGGLFVALPGERVDGHHFVAAAFAKGAIAALVQRDLPDWPTLDLRQPVTFEQALGLTLPVCLRVDDTLAALQTLGAAWRNRLNLRVIGITGSVGKTTSKELIAAVLGTRYRTFKTEGNYNNEIGLPLMLLKLAEAHERAVLEMGFYEIGEIAQLCHWAKPHVGVVNNVYAVHLERAGSIENIVQGKGELVEALPPAPAGVAILNRDDERVMRMAACNPHARLLTYGLHDEATLQAFAVSSHGLEGIRFSLRYRDEVVRNIRAPLWGQHSVHTALRAAAVGLAEGLTWDEIVAGLQASTAMQLRLVGVRGLRGSFILDDTYNASPESTIAALNLLAEIPPGQAGRRIAVLGDMLELGDYEETGHRLVGARARDVADQLVTVGQRARLIAEEARAAGLPATAITQMSTADEAAAWLQAELRAGDVVLLKASRGLRLDRAARAVQEADNGG